MHEFNSCVDEISSVVISCEEFDFMVLLLMLKNLNLAERIAGTFL